MMRKLIVLFTLLVMSSSAFAATQYLTKQTYMHVSDEFGGIRTCYYTGGHQFLVNASSYLGPGYCPPRIERGYDQLPPHKKGG